MRKFYFMLILLILTLLLSSLIIYADSDPVIQPPISNSNSDSDGDGLPDFQEKYKYYTDPNSKDSDNDGTPDGDWEERREYTYTLKFNLQITGPWDINSMNNDYQDTRIIKETKNYAECEIILYPENSIKEGIGRNYSWGDYGQEFDKYLKPYLYANWDEQMKKDLISELKGIGIDPEKLSDRDLVQKVSIWIEGSTESIEYRRPPQFYLKYDKNGKFYVDEKYRRYFEEFVKSDKSITLDELVNKLVLGKQMYYNKARGACTSSTTYAATIYRALGIPTRHVCTTKIMFKDDLLHLTENIKNPFVKELLLSTRKSSSNHMYNEVYLDGRWIRIDYNELGFSNIQAGRGIYYQHYSPNDLSELNMVDDYGAMVSRSDWGPFKNGEFFKLLGMSDNYGKYYKPHYGYGIDPGFYDGYSIVSNGDNEFALAAQASCVKELRKFKDMKVINIDRVTEEYFSNNNVLISSADIEYNYLPNIIRNQISKDEYMRLDIDDYKTIKINKGMVLIIKK
ncbi:MAG TPA: transglutaminase domain-containing protein [Clostridia bacterium]|nr:transglutaminase domain-containing protein [Clostridia bacterium]